MSSEPQQEVIVSGFGGQGVISLGRFIAHLAMEEGYYVTYIPSYGVEVRGGTASCTVIYSRREIASPVSASPTAVFAMNIPSAAKFGPRLRRGGLLIYNSSLVKDVPGREDIKKAAVPANDIAEASGDKRTANIVMFGAYLGLNGFSTVERACSMLKNILEGKEELIDVNVKALEEGFRFVA